MVIVVVNGKATEAYAIGDVAKMIGRKAQTIRKWELQGFLPPAHRDAVGRRGYTRRQVDAIVRLVRECGVQPGRNMFDTGFPDRIREEFEKIEEEV